MTTPRPDSPAALGAAPPDTDTFAQRRAEAVARVYARSARRLSLTPGQLTYIAQVDAARAAQRTA